MRSLTITFGVDDVMETVAHMTDGPEPPEAQAAAWMQEHANRLAEVMEYAAKEYLRRNWGTR